MKFLALLTCLLLPQLSITQEFSEGVHYSVVRTNNLPSTPETVEYFSYSCPACLRLEPYISALKETRPDIELRRVHAPYGGPQAEMSQLAFVLMHTMRVDHSEEIFRRIHEQGNTFDSEAELISFFEDLGYDKNILERTISSFSAGVMLDRMNAETGANQIRQIPTIIVNGKYELSIGSIYSGIEIADLIDYLNTL